MTLVEQKVLRFNTKVTIHVFIWYFEGHQNVNACTSKVTNKNFLNTPKTNIMCQLYLDKIREERP